MSFSFYRIGYKKGDTRKFSGLVMKRDVTGERDLFDVDQRRNNNDSVSLAEERSKRSFASLPDYEFYYAIGQLARFITSFH